MNSSVDGSETGKADDPKFAINVSKTPGEGWTPHNWYLRAQDHLPCANALRYILNLKSEKGTKQKNSRHSVNVASTKRKCVTHSHYQALVL